MKAQLSIVALGILTLGGLSPGSSDAQIAPGADKLTGAAVADSLAAVKQIDALLRRDGKNAALWLRRGMIAAALHTRAEADPPIKGLDVFAMRRMADTSMIIAGDLAPQSLEHQLVVGEWLRTATDLSTRIRATRYLDRAYELGRASGNPALHSRAALAIGRLHWLSYELAPWRAPPCELLSPSIDSATIVGTSAETRLTPQYAVKRLHNELVNCFGRTVMPDNADYMKAEEKFREARDLRPDDTRAFRHIAMVLLERKRWNELESLARARLARTRDVWALLALGLAQHRSGNAIAALASFDSGAALLEPAERGRLLSFTKLLTPGDSVAYVADGPEPLTAREREFWGFITPLWSRTASDPRAEFLAVGVDRDRDRVRYRFERITQHAPAIVDLVGLSLSETPAGDYRVVVEITDKVSGRKTSTSSVFTIRE